MKWKSETAGKYLKHVRRKWRGGGRGKYEKELMKMYGGNREAWQSVIRRVDTPCVIRTELNRVALGIKHCFKYIM